MDRWPPTEHQSGWNGPWSERYGGLRTVNRIDYGRLGLISIEVHNVENLLHWRHIEFLHVHVSLNFVGK